MIKCNECSKWFSEPELKQPINPRTGHVRWDETYAELCPKCGHLLDGTEIQGELCEWCEKYPPIKNHVCILADCPESVVGDKGENT